MGWMGYYNEKGVIEWDLRKMLTVNGAVSKVN